MRVVKAILILICLLAVVSGTAVYFGLKAFKNFDAYDVTVETIASDSQALLSHIEKIVSFGLRNPGTEGDRKTREYILSAFSEYGLKVQEPDAYDINMYHPEVWNLSLSETSAGSSINIPTFYIPFSANTASDGVSGSLAYVADEESLDGLDLDGKIAAYEMKFRPKGLKTYSKILYMYDPDQTLASSGRVVRAKLEYETRMYELLKAKGAIGMVGLLSGLQWDSDRYYPQMSFGLEKSIPGVWVRPSLCDTVREWAAKPGASATLKLISSISTGTTANEYAILPGQIDEYYVVFSQHDTYFDGAVQDASGVAVMLALAKHFATAKPLKRGIVFLSVAHTNGRAGEKNFIQNHGDGILSKTALVVAIEHIGRELDPQSDLTFSVSERPSFRMFFTALNKNVAGMVKSSILKHDYKRSVIIPQWLVEKITGKSRGISAEFHEFGLPVIGFMSNPPYMFFPEDTIDAVAADQLVPTANVIASIIRTADGMSGEDLR